MRLIQSEQRGNVLLINFLLLIQSVGCVDLSSGRDIHDSSRGLASGVIPAAGLRQAADDQLVFVYHSTDHSANPTTQSVPVTGERRRASKFNNPHLNPEERKAQRKESKRVAWRSYRDKMRKDPNRYSNYLERARENIRKNSYLNKAEKIFDPLEKEIFLKEARAKQAEKGRRTYYKRKQRTGFGSKKDQDHHQRVKALRAGTGTVEDILAVQTVREGNRERQARMKANRSEPNTLQRRSLTGCKRTNECT